MRYAIYFTPSMYDPLSVAAASWLGRNVYSGEAPEAPSIAGFSRQELAFHTAVPRRYGFHGTIKAPFRLHDDTSEPMLLKALMKFASTMAPGSKFRRWKSGGSANSSALHLRFPASR